MLTRWIGKIERSVFHWAAASLRILSPRAQLEIARLYRRFRQSIWNRIQYHWGYDEYVAVQISSSAYSRQHPSARSGVEKSIRKLMDGLEPGSVILDAGCGDGYGLELLQDEGFPAIGFDLNIEKLTDARDHGSKLVFVGDLHHIALPPNSVDIIHCSHVLEHLLDTRHALAELRRVLRTSGKSLFVLPLSPGNYKHPSPFLDESDIHRSISPHFQIEHLVTGYGRGNPEACVLARKQAQKIHSG
ncbi:MAG: class I SAM-dependent methyltransferase [Anaerolineales bacterium]